MKRLVLTLAVLFMPDQALAQDICAVQSKLRDLGYFKHEITCNSGELTERAIRNFQADKGLVEDGIPGEDTLKALFEDNDNERKAPRVVVEREREMTDPERFARCGDDLIEATVERAWQSRGVKGAIKAWEAKVLATDGLGIRYSNYENATDKAKPECLRAGSLAVNCTVRARPCKAGE